MCPVVSRCTVMHSKQQAQRDLFTTSSQISLNYDDRQKFKTSLTSASGQLLLIKSLTRRFRLIHSTSEMLRSIGHFTYMVVGFWLLAVSDFAAGLSSGLGSTPESKPNGKCRNSQEPKAQHCVCEATCASEQLMTTELIVTWGSKTDSTPEREPVLT